MGLVLKQLQLPLSGVRHCYNEPSTESVTQKMMKVSIVDCSLHTTLLKYLAFFCDKEAGSEGLNEVTTTQVEKRVRDRAELTSDTLLLAKLGSSDMIALEAKYHIKCLLAVYNHARKVRRTQLESGSEEDEQLYLLNSWFTLKNLV